MEKYSPVKELPAEITNLPQEDTVCSYCGISYLVHHEIKRLEQALQESSERLRMLEKEKLSWQVQKQDLEYRLKQREEKLTLLDTDLVCTEAKLSLLQKECKDLTEESNAWSRELKSERAEMVVHKQLLFERVGGLQSTFQCLKTSLNVGVNDVKEVLSQCLTHWSLSQQQVHQAVKALKQKIDNLHRRLIEEANERRDLSNQFDLTKTDLLDENFHCKQSLKDVEKELLELKLERDSMVNEKESLKQKAHWLTEDLRLQELRNQETKAEGHRRISAIREESNRLIQGAENSILELKDTIASLSVSLHGKEQRIAELNSLLGSKETEMKSCIEKGGKQYKQLQERLVRVKVDCESQLSELKLGCSRRVSALNEEFSKREQELKDAFAIRDVEYQNTIIKLKSTLTASELKCQRVIDSLREQLGREKDLFDQEMSRHLQQVKDLEMKVANLRLEKDMTVKNEAFAQQTLVDVERKCSELDKKLASAYKEISTLQAVVQRQCEERQRLEPWQ